MKIHLFFYFATKAKAAAADNIPNNRDVRGASSRDEITPRPRRGLRRSPAQASTLARSRRPRPRRVDQNARAATSGRAQVFTGSATIVDGAPALVYAGRGDPNAFGVAVPANPGDPLLVNWTKRGALAVDTDDDPSAAWREADRTWRLVANGGCGAGGASLPASNGDDSRIVRVATTRIVRVATTWIVRGDAAAATRIVDAAAATRIIDEGGDADR